MQLTAQPIGRIAEAFYPESTDEANKTFFRQRLFSEISRLTTEWDDIAQAVSESDASPDDVVTQALIRLGLEYDWFTEHGSDLPVHALGLRHPPEGWPFSALIAGKTQEEALRRLEQLLALASLEGEASEIEPIRTAFRGSFQSAWSQIINKLNADGQNDRQDTLDAIELNRRLLAAARQVITCWVDGNLARSVAELETVVRDIDSARATALKNNEDAREVHETPAEDAPAPDRAPLPTREPEWVPSEEDWYQCPPE